MKPETKTMLLVAGSIVGIFLVPAVLVIFHDYINAFLAIVFVLASFWVFGYYSYQEFLPIVQQAQLEEEEIVARFAGNPEQMRFYRGFKKHFDGELNVDELKQWLINHPRKH